MLRKQPFAFYMAILCKVFYTPLLSVSRIVRCKGTTFFLITIQLFSQFFVKLWQSEAFLAARARFGAWFRKKTCKFQ
jgi:hypothetical protein